jgi:CRP-like cAMP-binding protein
MTRKSVIETKKFTEGEIIYSHNDLSDYIYLIESGEVKILSKNGLELGLLKEGEIFGEVGHVIKSPRTVSAIATKKSLIKIINENVLVKKMNEADPLLSAIIRGLSLRIGDANDLAEKYWIERDIYKSIKD